MLEDKKCHRPKGLSPVSLYELMLRSNLEPNEIIEKSRKEEKFYEETQLDANVSSAAAGLVGVLEKTYRPKPPPPETGHDCVLHLCSSVAGHVLPRFFVDTVVFQVLV